MLPCTVTLSKKSARRIQRYLNAVDISIDEAVSDAVIEWMNSAGDVTVEILQRRRAKRSAGPQLVSA
ncbi:MAG TPA: hypothetical protein VGG45_10755 [Terracidiphilus sp.]|jgi:hypothetical protein